MRLVHRLFLLATVALAAFALSATHANAQIEVFNEATDEHCGAVVVDGHEANGGCHVEYLAEEHISFVAHPPTGPVVLLNCNWHLEAQIGEDGSGYVTHALLTDEVPPSSPPCTRTPCDEAAPSHEDLLWPLQIEENSPGQESLELEFCIRTANAFGGVEGGTQSRCEVHFPFTSDAGHNHEMADHAEYFCEVSAAPVPISIQEVHFINENPAEASEEDIYLLH